MHGWAIVLQLVVILSTSFLPRPTTCTLNAPVRLRIQDLPPLALDRIQSFLPSNRDRIQFGLSHRHFLPAIFQPSQSEARRGITAHCNPNLAHVWFQHYFRNPIHDQPHQKLRMSHAEFFDPACMQALSAFCAEDRWRRRTSADDAPVRLDLDRVSAQRLERIRLDFAACHADLQMKVADDWESLEQLRLLVKEDISQHTYTVILEAQPNQDGLSELADILASGTERIQAVGLAHAPSPQLFRHLLRAIHQNPAVKALSLLELHSNEQQQELLQELADALRGNLQLHALLFHQIQFTADDVQILFGSLAFNPNLDSLFFLSNPRLPLAEAHQHVVAAFAAKLCRWTKVQFAGNPFTAQDLHTLAEALRRNRSIQELDLRQLSLPTAAAENGEEPEMIALVEALQQHPHLRVLDLSSNELIPSISQAIGRMLMGNQQLQQLRLRSCFSTANAWYQLSHIVAGLRQNRGLKQLALDSNALGNHGALMLGRMLAKNQHLESLSCDICDLEHQGASYLLDGLAQNPHSALRQLSLMHNMIGEEYRSLSALQHLRSLVTLNLAMNGFGPVALGALVRDLTVAGPSLQNVIVYEYRGKFTETIQKRAAEILRDSHVTVQFHLE